MLQYPNILHECSPQKGVLDDCFGSCIQCHVVDMKLDAPNKRFLWLGAVRYCCVLAAFCSIKNAARSRSLEAQGSCCSFWPKLSNDPNLSKIRPCLAEIGPTLFQPNQQERTAPNQRNRLSPTDRTSDRKQDKTSRPRGRNTVKT